MRQPKFSTPTRRRSTKADIARLEHAILDILADDHPQSIRHLFYRLVSLPALDLPKDESTYKKVQQRVVLMRRQARIDYGYIADAMRRGYHVNEYDSPEQFVRSMGRLYRGRLWTQDLPRVEVWVESRSLGGVLKDTCEDLAVSLYPSGGFASLTLCYEAAMTMNYYGRPVVVLYIGDYDASGTMIDASIERELREHLEVDLEFRRLAVNESQIDTLGLPTRPPKPSEKRRGPSRTVEAEAIAPSIMREIVRDAVESYLPPGQLHAVKVAEEAERQALEMFQFSRL